MTNANAEGRKTQDDLADRINDTFHVLMDGVCKAMTHSQERNQDNRYPTDGTGRLRDREIGHAAKLAAVGAQLANTFIRLQATMGRATREK